MIGFLKCVVYLGTLGILSHFVGESLPRGWFVVGRFPWRPFRFENNGKLYDSLNIRAWQDKLPDMSRVMPDMIPKRVGDMATAEDVERLTKETCVAEMTHDFLIILGFGCSILWDACGGWIISIIYAVGNVPFIMIQRYNRPRLVRLALWLGKREAGKERESKSEISPVDPEDHKDVNEMEVLHENVDSEL